MCSVRKTIALSGLVFFLAGVPASPQEEVAQTPAGSKALTVESIYGENGLLGHSLPRIAWTPDGKQLGFMETGLGKEFWVMDAATGERHILIPADTLKSILPPMPFPVRQRTGAGRRPPAPFEFAPDGSAILFRGQTSLVWFDLKSHASRRLISGGDRLTDAKISPDSRWVSFVRDHNVSIANVSSGEVRPLTKGGSEGVRKGELDWVYPEELEIKSGYWWAPDSSAIAYLEMDERKVTQYTIENNIDDPHEKEVNRYARAGEPNPIVRVLVASLGGGEPRAMDIGTNTDISIARVDWMTDNKHLAIQRLERTAKYLELLNAEAATGRSHVILTEKDRCYVNVTDILHFFHDGQRFLWASERSGYRHLYIYKLDGTEIAQITKGDWEVSNVEAVDEAHGLVYFTAAEKSPLERQLYRVALDGSGFARISHETGTHSPDFAPGAGVFVDTYSDTLVPPRQDLLRANGSKISAVNEGGGQEVQSYHLSPVEYFTVKVSDGATLNASMIKPPNFDPSKKYPVIVFTYGGPSQVVRRVWAGGNFLFNEMMAQKGYIIFSLDNRGAQARGRDFERKVYGYAGPPELADQHDGVAYLRTLPYVDDGRVGIWGWSYGGTMTLHALFEDSQTFKVGFAGAPVSNWLDYDSIATERFLGLPKDNPDGYRVSSPVNFVAGLQGKLLIGQGTGDDNVHLINTIEVLNESIKHGKYIETVLLPGRGHPASDPPVRILLMNRVADFFQKNL